MNEQGGPAFPFGYETGFKTFKQYSGMSLRDYFAAKAMPSIYSTAMTKASHGVGVFNDINWRIGLAIDAYKMADAMLAAREAK